MENINWYKNELNKFETKVITIAFFFCIIISCSFLIILSTYMDFTFTYYSIIFCSLTATIFTVFPFYYFYRIYIYIPDAIGLSTNEIILESNNKLRTIKFKDLSFIIIENDIQNHYQ